MIREGVYPYVTLAPNLHFKITQGGGFSDVFVRTWKSRGSGRMNDCAD